jgi:hypothetical protein
LIHLRKLECLLQLSDVLVNHLGFITQQSSCVIPIQPSASLFLSQFKVALNVCDHSQKRQDYQLKEATAPGILNHTICQHHRLTKLHV